MTSLNDTEKVNFITNNFHQYFDLTLNKYLSTTETINLVIPLKDLKNNSIIYEPVTSFEHYVVYEEDYKIEDILSKYPDTSLKGEMCICTNVVDGDTIDVKIPKKENGEIVSRIERVRLVGVNAPETGMNGSEVSKEFMEKVCYSKEYLKKLNRERDETPWTERETEYYKDIYNNKKIYIKIDEKKPIDSSDSKRLLAVLIVDNKNINEVLLKENIAEVMYIPPSEFYPFNWKGEKTATHIWGVQNDDITTLHPYFNNEMTNVVFTPKDDPTKIYRYEIYKGVYYIRLQPYSREVRMHILPKAYDCSNTVLFFRDDMLTDENIDKTDDYCHYSVGNFINSYYLEDGDIRDRTEPDISDQRYNLSDWTDTHCDFSYNISKDTQLLNKIQICSGYTYNNSTPYYSVHYTGVRDFTNIAAEDRCTLIDVNLDKIENISNNITQYNCDNEKNLYIQKPAIIRAKYPTNVDHVTELGTEYHKVLKYINDSLYSEESYLKNTNPIQNIRHYITADWVDMSQGEMVLSVFKKTFEYGENILLKGTVNSGQRNGVKIFKNNTLIRELDTDIVGNFSLNINSLSPGEYTFKAIYDGNDFSEIESNIIKIKIVNS